MRIIAWTCSVEVGQQNSWWQEQEVSEGHSIRRCGVETIGVIHGPGFFLPGNRREFAISHSIELPRNDSRARILRLREIF